MGRPEKDNLMENPTLQESVIYLALTEPGVDISMMAEIYLDLDHRPLWREALKLRGETISLVTLMDNPDKRLGMIWIKCYSFYGILVECWADYCDRLRAAYVRSKLNEVLDKCQFTDANEAAETVKQWAKELNEAESKSLTLKLPADYVHVWLEEIEAKRGMKPELLTGFQKLDSMSWGLHRGEVITIGARTSKGKSTFALNITANLVRQKKKILFFSTEMSIQEKWSRIICHFSNVDFSKFRKVDFNMSDWAQISKAAEQLHGDYFHVCDYASPTIEQVETLCNKVKPDVMVLDYLGMFSLPKATREDQAISEFMRRVKILARQQNVSVIVVSQVNRNVDNRPNPIPTMADLKSSGSIEQESDIVMLLYPDSERAPQGPTRPMILDIAKNRHGECILLKLDFYLPTLRMTEAEDYGDRKSAAGGN